MSIRAIVYRSTCVVLGLYAVGSAAYVAQWARGRVFDSSPLLFFILAHAFLLGMASLRAGRPARTGSPGGLLLSLAMALAIVAGAAVRIAPEWMPPARLALLAFSYIALRMSAPTAPARER